VAPGWDEHQPSSVRAASLSTRRQVPLAVCQAGPDLVRADRLACRGRIPKVNRQAIWKLGLRRAGPTIRAPERVDSPAPLVYSRRFRRPFAHAALERRPFGQSLFALVDLRSAA